MRGLIHDDFRVLLDVQQEQPKHKSYVSPWE